MSFTFLENFHCKFSNILVNLSCKNFYLIRLHAVFFFFYNMVSFKSELWWLGFLLLRCTINSLNFCAQVSNCQYLVHQYSALKPKSMFSFRDTCHLKKKCVCRPRSKFHLSEVSWLDCSLAHLTWMHTWICFHQAHKSQLHLQAIIN